MFLEHFVTIFYILEQVFFSTVVLQWL